MTPQGGSDRLGVTAEGSHPEAFGAAEWGLVATTAGVWGSSYLWIAIGLRDLPPTGVTVLRLALGALALGLVPRARRPVAAGDRGRLLAVSVMWLTLPMLAFPIAQQWVDSSLVGLLNAAVPILTALIASLLLRRLPGDRQLAGLAAGLVGLAVLAGPQLAGADATALGVALILVTMATTAGATSLLVPLQQRYGALPVVWRAQLVALTISAPLGVPALLRASPSAGSLAAMLPLGLASTGVAFVTWTALVGRAGAARGSLVSYLVPVVAVLLGVVVLDEALAPTTLAGAAFVVVGAVLLGGRDARAPRPLPEPPATPGPAGPA